MKHIVRAEDVKPGAAVLDVGVTRETDPEEIERLEATIRFAIAQQLSKNRKR